MSSRRSASPGHNEQAYAESIEIQPQHYRLMQKLAGLRQESRGIAHNFEQFRELMMHELNKAMGRISSLIQREVNRNAKLTAELELVTQSNIMTKKQVVGLRQMIQDFMKGSASELEAKEAEIRELKLQLGIEANPDKNGCPSVDQDPPQKRQSLEIIQEVSQYTASCRQTMREISMPNSAKHSQIMANNNMSESTETNYEDWIEDGQPRKSKSFLKCFRENLEDTKVIEEEKILVSKDSHSSSINDEMHMGESDKITVPKIIKSPKPMNFLKKGSAVLTIEEDKENVCIELKTPHRRNLSDHHKQMDKSDSKSDKISRSSSKAGSREKIKLASKLVEEPQNFAKTKKPIGVVRPSVHLGGKAYLKKLAKDTRTALQDYRVWEGTRAREVKFEGERKNGMRWGKGKLLYDNGFEFEGSFIQNYKHGVGTISLNGIVFYQGQWSLDQISGQGYIKSLKNFSEQCPKALHEASYCGQLLQNKPHGMGTLFIGQDEKFVTKFVHGVPVGDFTYYHNSQIQFGTWF